MARFTASLPSLSEQHLFADAAKRYDIAAVRAYIDRNPAYVNVQPAGRWSALHQFAEKGDAETVRYLLMKGAEIAAKTNDGQTAHELATQPDVALLLNASISARSAAPLSAGALVPAPVTGGALVHTPVPASLVVAQPISSVHAAVLSLRTTQPPLSATPGCRPRSPRRAPSCTGSS